MKLTYTEDYNDIARNSQRNDFVNALCDKALCAVVSHNDVIIESQMHNCIIDDVQVSKDQFKVILTVDYYRDK